MICRKTHYSLKWIAGKAGADSEDFPAARRRGRDWSPGRIALKIACIALWRWNRREVEDGHRQRWYRIPSLPSESSRRAPMRAPGWYESITASLCRYPVPDSSMDWRWLVHPVQLAGRNISILALRTYSTKLGQHPRDFRLIIIVACPATRRRFRPGSQILFFK